MIVRRDSTEVCVCGGIGCLEVAVSLRRMEQRAWAMRDEWPESLLFRNKSKQISYSMIFDAVNAGDVFACTLLDEVTGYFAIGINNITQICDPGLFIIQGEYVEAGDYFLRQLRESLTRMSLLRMDKGVRVEFSSHGDERTLSGAAHFVADKFFADFTV